MEGRSSTPTSTARTPNRRKIDKEKPLFGQRSLTKRLARTVFFGAAPTIGAAHKGMETQRVFLGTAMPGDVPGNFHCRADRARRPGDVLLLRLGQVLVRPAGQHHPARPRTRPSACTKRTSGRRSSSGCETRSRTRGDFAGVHVCPEDNADIPDTDEARLVILHPKAGPQAQGADSAAKEFAHKATEQRGTANRTNRNMLVFLPPDTTGWPNSTAPCATTSAGRTC